MPVAPGVRNLSLFLAPFVLNAASLAREIKTRTGNMLDKTKNVNTIVRLIRFLGNFAETIFFSPFSFKVAIFFLPRCISCQRVSKDNEESVKTNISDEAVSSFLRTLVGFEMHREQTITVFSRTG